MSSFTKTLFQLLKSQKAKWFMNEKPISISRVNLLKLFYSTKSDASPSEKMTEILRLKFPLAKQIDVVDVSGGCGSMYQIFVESVEFKGLTTVKQHRLINEVLKEDIKKMHGLRIETKVPDANG